MRPIDADDLLEIIEKYCGDYDCHDSESFDKQAVRMAIRSAPTLTQPNEPLTIEQLREMDGEPVWFDTIKRWGIVKVCRDGVFVLTKSGEFEVGRCKYYRRQPEGEVDGK